MANKNAENKSAFENGMFLKVDCVEPVYKNVLSICGDGPYLAGIKVWIDGNGHFFECDRYTVCDPDLVREDGRRQVVELMNELMNMTIADNNKLFGYGLAHNILNHFSYEEIVEKLDAWKKEKENEPIHIKDEVVQKLDSRLKFVVTEVHDGNGDTYISGVSKDGKVYPGHNIKNYKKTGLHVDDLDSYLEV